jgi:adenylate cyclase
VEPAPELIQVVERIFKTYASESADGVIDIFSREPGTSLIGTDGDEFYSGFDTVAAFLRVWFAEGTPGSELELVRESIEAWKEGTVGWVVMSNRMKVPDRGVHTSRATLIFHEDGAHWRAVHWHASIGVSNQEAFGKSGTTSIDEIVRLVEEFQTPVETAAADGTVAVMFTDVVGSTALMEQLGESRWLEIFNRHAALVQQQTSMFGGAVVKNQGDGFMLAFPAMGSAAACAIGLQRAISKGFEGINIHVRMGIHLGNATAESGDFFGRTVVIASRLSAAASSDEILISEEAAAAIGDAFSVGALRQFNLKGLAGDLLAAQLTWQ